MYVWHFFILFVLKNKNILPQEIIKFIAVALHLLKKISNEPSGGGGGSNCKVAENKRLYNALMPIRLVSVNQNVLRHLFFANFILKFVKHDFRKLGSVFLETTL